MFYSLIQLDYSGLIFSNVEIYLAIDDLLVVSDNVVIRNFILCRGELTAWADGDS